jgi:YegS/Rv2252/BmrU family lipid kinase
MTESKTKILFIINPAAGIKRERDLQGIIRENLDLYRFDYQVNVTSRQGDALEFTKQAIAKDFGIIVAVGGDGTINEIATGIEETGAVLSIVPNGSGNGLARHLEIPLDISEAIRIINTGKVKVIDTATLNGQTFVSIAGVGFDAKVASIYRKARRRGFYGYFRIVVLEFLGYKERHYQLEIDGKQLERDAFFISIANSNQFGYGTVIAPSARLDDGLLNVVIARKFPLAELPYILQQLFTHKIDKSTYVESHLGKEVVIMRDEGKWVNLDGEAVKSDPVIHISVRPSSLKVIVPESPPQAPPGAYLA